MTGDPDCARQVTATGTSGDRQLQIGWTRRWISAPGPLTTSRGDTWEPDAAIARGGTLAPVGRPSTSPAGSPTASQRLDPACYLFPIPAGGTWLVTFGVPAGAAQSQFTYNVSADSVGRPLTQQITADGHVQRVSFLVAAQAGPLRVTIVKQGFTTAITSAAITLARRNTTPLQVAFADEFNGAPGGPDDRNWRVETGSGTWGNNELQTYTTNPANIRVNSGHLAISAQRDHSGSSVRYTSGRLNSNFTGTYGRVEARIKVPNGAGLLPAFWMLGADAPHLPWPACGEIDIMEYLGNREPTTIYTSLHGPDRSGAPWKQTTSTVTARPPADNFHTYALDWWPGLLQVSLDGRIFASYTPQDLSDRQTWVFDKQYYLLLNVAVGGDWPGTPAPSLPFPQTMLVDYVRWSQ